MGREWIRPRLSIGMLLVLSTGCEQFERRLETCDPEKVDELSVSAPVVETVVVEPVTDALTLSGSLDADARVGAFTIAQRPVKGTADNYARWSIDIPRSVLLDSRTGSDTGNAELPVHLEDTCGNEVVVDAIEIPVAAAPSTPPMGMLSVAVNVVAMPIESTCYAPGDGSVVLEAVAHSTDRRDVGLPVQFVPSVGMLAGAAAGHLEADPVGGASARVDVVAVGIADAKLRVTASIGSSTVISGPRPIAGPPVFSDSESELPAGEETLLVVETRGEFESCRAEATWSGAVAQLVGPGHEPIDLFDPSATLPDAEGCDHVFGILV